MKSCNTIWLCGMLCAFATHAGAIPKLENLPEHFDAIRDPMIPPGVTVNTAAPTQEDIQRDAMAAQIAWPKLQLRGITHTGTSKFVAIIDRLGIVEEGDVVRMRQGNLVYTWRIDTITAEGLSSTRMHVAPADQPQKPIQILVPTTAP
ncbi:MAG: hypothetical protein ACNA71_03480 [Kiritimatiellia bacterium]